MSLSARCLTHVRTWSLLAALAPVAGFADAATVEDAPDAALVPGTAAALSQVARLLPHPDGLPGDPSSSFGGALALDGDTAVVGAPYDDSLTTDGGAVYVFVRAGATWTLQQTLLVPEPGSGGWFGFSVAVSGDTLVAGAPTHDPPAGNNAGAAWVFVRSGGAWSQQKKLTPTDAAEGDSFGRSVAITGDTLVVGAPYADTPTGGFDAGAAYAFARSGTSWSEPSKLTAADGAVGDNFGTAVAISGTTAVVGAPRDGTGTATSVGSVYAFVRSGSTWTQQQKLLASGGATGDQFGTSVAIAGDTLVAGAILDDAPPADSSGSAFVFVRSGGVWSEQQKLVASDRGNVDNFGVSVAIAGETVAVGAHFADPPAGAEAGAAYVYVRASGVWSEQQKLTAGDGAANDRFGQAVALSGETAIIGAPFHATAPGWPAGAAYALVRSGTSWSPQQQLVGRDSAGGDQLGLAVALDGDTLAAGAWLDDTPASASSGAAVVFVRAAGVWSEQQKLFAHDGERFDRFGWALALDGDTLAVGAPEDDEGTSEDVGAAYVFVRSGTTWTEQQKLTAPDGTTEAFFGTSVALSGDTLAVGTLADTAAGLDAGAVYVFVRSGTTWTLQQKLTAAGAQAGDRFGNAVALAGDRLAVGAPTDDTPAGQDAGSVRVFERTGTLWSEGPTLVASDAAAADWFGVSVALSGDTLAAGAWNDDTPAGVNTGSAYVFVLTGTVWAEQQKLVAGDAAGSDSLGLHIALDGDFVAVSAHLHDTPAGANAGTAYVFARSGGSWTERVRLRARDATASDFFGFAVALRGNTVVAGAPLHDLPDSGSSGAVYVFEPRLKGDFDRDLQTDLLLRNNPGAFHEAWGMDGVVRREARRIVPDLPDPAWQVAGVDDFDGDGRDDLALWNSSSGVVEFWLMDGAARIGAPVPLTGAPVLATNWRLSATGDFNADGNPDLVWRNVSSQKIVIWTLRGTARLGTIVPTPDQAVDPNWDIAAALDYNGDGTRDFLWYNADSGKIVLWFMDASVVRLSGQFTNPSSAGNNNWKVLAGGDYGSGAGGLAGANDIVWRNADSGRLVVWYMDLAANRTGGTFTTPDAPGPSALDWTVAGPR